MTLTKITLDNFVAIHLKLCLTHQNQDGSADVVMQYMKCRENHYYNNHIRQFGCNSLENGSYSRWICSCVDGVNEVSRK